MIRLNKYLADCGVGSRRQCDEYIADGVVKVNGKRAVVGQTVEERDVVTVEGRRVAPKTKLYYVMLHKPKGCVCTVRDDRGRKTVMDFIDLKARLFPVGRLDYDTEGLLLLTNDGEVANVLTHPSHSIKKTYVARVSGAITESQRRQLEQGVEVDGKTTLPAQVTLLESDGNHTRVEVVITEGRNRQVKKMFQSVGAEVEFLKRTAVGELHLGGLQRGKYRFLNEKEMQYIKGLK